MTTTSQTHGGGAQPASIDTSGKMTGGAALRVYGFDSEAAAEAAGFVCEGGPAMSVSLITDAQIASGEWKLDGDPFALAVYTAPSNMSIEGGFAVPVYPINGWGSAPAPVPPLFVSAEVGTVNASTVAVTFDQDVSASDYSAGVTIKVNGSDAMISSATRQSNHAIVYYALSAAVVFGDVVTWEYAEASGNIVAEDDSTPLEDVSAQSVTNNVPSIGDTLRADAVAYWKMDEASGTRNDSSSNVYHLSEMDGSIAAVAGKIGNAAKNIDSGDLPPYFEHANVSVDFASGLTFCCWAKFNQYPEDAYFDLIEFWGIAGTGLVWAAWIGPKTQLDTDMVFREGSGAVDQWTASLSLNTWHFLVCWKNASADSVAYLQADNGPVVEVSAAAIPNPKTIDIVGASYLDSGSEISIDEAGLWNRALTQDERDYLWNGGAGRALFPAP